MYSNENDDGINEYDMYVRWTGDVDARVWNNNIQAEMIESIQFSF